MGGRDGRVVCGVWCVPSGLDSLNRGAGFALGPGALVCGGGGGGCVWRAGAGARAVTLLGGARVGYLRGAAAAAPAAFEEEAPMVGRLPYMYVRVCERAGVG